ncbi:extracellular solute-binding protein [Nocardiopsis dassonvillei]|uniref:Extracellular solute-binding protein family 1 n=1 Tax=Nocardiopsis dassonvillei (strain ATCC 23218 / DSM 43111 / CIP 107115 / JCM 7437 / KCTC 9190 / NBRC 14626 / NCTC 10488 / NRRL B-5397 / IMRU 509) TaxID=446468 RepID=D7B611_NOCDD|nr:extracellular solute-binding protein [Nocardiopsis dassonvillei]ADH65464.1 extracellular solute-binding protein family 1 [Nocardiopsis dassonvillei subsp. dassonvillei DSM 43111]NKY79597.1 extracellular solute-binding protein [Nocardiopsis dassonvillei]VEI90781.1 Probable ABC transporter-binding protein DR_1438 precursor [Nocardiopsis dassonvillei]
MRARPRPPRPVVCALLSLLLLGSAACDARGERDERVLRVALPVDVTATEDTGGGGVYTRLIERWEAENEGWEVDVRWLSPRADEQRSQMVVAMQADPAAYDVLLLDNQWVPEFHERGWLAEVDTGGDGPLAWNGFLGRARDAVCYEGRARAVPFHMDVGLLYYRADLVGPEEVTARIEEDGWRGLLGLADEVRDEHGLEHGYTGQFGDYEGLTVNALEFVLGGHPGLEADSRGTFHGSDGADGGGAEDGCVTSAGASGEFQGLEVLEAGLEPEAGGVIPRAALEETETESLNRFRGGEVVFMRHWPRVVPQLQADSESAETLREGLRWVGWAGEAGGGDPAFGVLRLPAAVLGGNSLAVTGESPHRDEAWSLVAAMTGQEVQAEFREAGLLPARGSGYRLSDAEDRDVRYWEELRDAVGEGLLRPRTPYYPYVSEVLRDHVDTQIRPGSTDPHPEDMVCELNAALAGKVSTCG